MMTDDGSRFRIHRLDIIHQLPTVTMSTETIDGNHIASDRHHVRVSTIIDGDLGKSFLQSTTQSSICLISYQT